MGTKKLTINIYIYNNNIVGGFSFWFVIRRSACAPRTHCFVLRVIVIVAVRRALRQKQFCQTLWWSFFSFVFFSASYSFVVCSQWHTQRTGVTHTYRQTPGNEKNSIFLFFSFSAFLFSSINFPLTKQVVAIITPPRFLFPPFFLVLLALV